MSDPTEDVVMDNADQKATGDVTPALNEVVVASAHAPPIASEDPSNATPGGGNKTVRKIAGKGTAKNGGGSSADDSGSSKFKPGDIVLTKLKGYPLWPSVVVNPDDVPEGVQAERPKANIIYCTMFFPDGNYSWSAPRDLTPLRPHDIASYLESGAGKKTSGQLYKGYKIAQDPEEFIQEKLEAVKASAALGNGGAAADDEDELAQDEDEEDENVGKKRKRVEKKEAPAKKAKATKETKSKKAVKDDEEDEIEEPASKRKTKAAPKAKKEKVDKAAPKSAPKEEEGDEDDALAKNPEAVKVKEWRHKLQRAFLTKHDLPSAEEMPEYDKIFKTIEEYQNMTVEYLAYSKLGKVMKKIAALPNIVSNDEYKLSDRALKLMNDWSKVAGGTVSDAVAKVADVNVGAAVSDAVAKVSEVNVGEVITNTASAAVEAVGDAATAVKDAVVPVANGVVEGAKDLVNGAVEQMQVDEKEPEAASAST